MQRRLLKELELTQWLDAATLRARQLEMLNSVIAAARCDVPLYRDRLGPAGPPLSDLEGLRSLPTTTKADLQQPRVRIVSGSYRGRRLLEIHTGGTTGKPLTVYCTQAVVQRNYAFFARFRGWTGASPFSSTAIFAGRTIVPPGQRRPPFWRRNPANNSLQLSSYHLSPDTLPSYVEALARFRPEIIDSYPSSIEPVARYIRDRGVTTIRPRAVITSSETLTAEARAVIESAFGCRVFDHYGAAEMAALITQCDRGSYHVNPEFGVVELLRDGRPAAPGEAGEIVATGFINPVMPLIRYRTGDVGLASAASCTCGRAFPTIGSLIGRLDDVIITPEGRRIGRLDPIFKAVAGLHETRLVQDGPDHVRVEIVATQLVMAAERKRLHFEIANRLGPSMRVDIVQVDHIPRAGSGKLRTVENLVHGSASRPLDNAEWEYVP